MLKVFTDKRYSGFVWHLLFAGVFIGLSLIFIEFTEGIMWYLISSVLRIIFGIAILIVSTRLFSHSGIARGHLWRDADSCCSSCTMFSPWLQALER